MEEVSHKMLLEAIKIFKDREGIKTPLDGDKIDQIIRELKEKK